MANFNKTICKRRRVTIASRRARRIIATDDDGKRVVYIYHDAVDAIGDDSKTEGHTFEAVRKAINELTALVGYIVNSLNGHHILVTADHGFLFTETGPVETRAS
jgi:hypothetical protein